MATMQLHPGHLFVCADCGLQFREPSPNEVDLLRCYSALPDSIWQQSDPRPYWQMILQAMNRFAANRIVLDVGCYRGDFLVWLPAEWERFGVEPSQAAAKIAAERGIGILGKTLEDCCSPQSNFGCVTAMDIIEHLIRPMPFLQRIRDCLAPNGCIVIITGATDTLAYALFGRRYWYCSLPEHMTFYNLRWFQWAAKQLGMQLVYHKYFSSEPTNAGLWLRQGVQLSLHTLVQALRRRGIPDRTIRYLPYGSLALSWRAVPWWKQAKDHILVVLTKLAPSNA
jgi:SAM-dependent methyltransferase